jgi:hypothetical protein
LGVKKIYKERYHGSCEKRITEKIGMMKDDGKKK